MGGLSRWHPACADIILFLCTFVGHGIEMNGLYFRSSTGETLNGRPVYRHTDPLSYEYGDDAGGKHLALWFGGKDSVWAVSVEAGSADVIAYVSGDVLSKPRADEGGEDWIAGEWQVSDGEDQYKRDPGVIAVWVTSREALDSAASGGAAAANLEDLVSETGDFDDGASSRSRGAAVDSAADGDGDGDGDGDDEDVEVFTKNQVELQGVLPSIPDGHGQAKEQNETIAVQKNAIKRTQGSGQDSGDDSGDGSAGGGGDNGGGGGSGGGAKYTTQRALPLQAAELQQVQVAGSPGAAIDTRPGTETGDETAAAAGGGGGSEGGGGKKESKLKKGRRGSFRDMFVRKAKSMKSKVAGKLSRLSHRQLPSDALKKATEKLRAERSQESRVFLAMSLTKMVRAPKHPKETGTALRTALLSAWEVCVDSVEKQLVAPAAWSQNTTYFGVYYDAIISVMVHADVQLFNMDEDPTGREMASLLHLRTHRLVATALGRFSYSGGFCIDAKEHEAVILFCAKALAINYFCIPKLAHVICSSISQSTPIFGRRSKAMGASMVESTAKAQATQLVNMPQEHHATVAYFAAVCGVQLTEFDQHPATLRHKMPLKLRTVGSLLLTAPLIGRILAETDPGPSAPATPPADNGHSLRGPWTQCFVTSTNAGFGFFSIFMEVLFRRSKTLFLYNYFENQRETQLGVPEYTPLAHSTAFVPGFCELQTCFLRLSLLSEYALKRAFRIGAGPPSIVCNWTDRTAACALTLSQSGTFFSCLLQDMMSQTSTTHVADVMALLGSLKALFESYHHMHETVLPHDLDQELIVRFLSQLVTCTHYVVTMFALRWIYDCLDYFAPHIRSTIVNRVLQPDVLSNLFCHWEPSVRNLMHMLIIYRLYEPEYKWQQRFMLNVLGTHLDSRDASLIDPRTYRPRNAIGSTIETHRGQLETLRSFLAMIISCHAEAAPPYTAESILPGAAAASPSCGSKYAAASVRDFREALRQAARWLQEHRRKGADEMYPPLMLSTPPLQNMTSAYIKARQRKTVPPPPQNPASGIRV